ncbi:MAG: ParA family protein [Desulfuromonadales bacterium]
MIISVINNKGGVGKSTVCMNLGHALALRGKKILVIDMDSQSNTTSILAELRPDSKTLYDMIASDIPVDECIKPTVYSNLHILPNSDKTAVLEPRLYLNLAESYQFLYNRVRDYATKTFDITLIDCPPNLGLFVMMSLVASDSAIVPIKAGSRFSFDGFKSAHEAILSTAKSAGTDLKFLKAIINYSDMRTRTSRSALEYLQANFADMIFNTTIPKNIQFEAAESERKTIIHHASSAVGALKFRELAGELIDLIAAEKKGAPPKKSKKIASKPADTK